MKAHPGAVKVKSAEQSKLTWKQQRFSLKTWRLKLELWRLTYIGAESSHSEVVKFIL
jgi:hypothetical protein